MLVIYNGCFLKIVKFNNNLLEVINFGQDFLCNVLVIKDGSCWMCDIFWSEDNYFCFVILSFIFFFVGLEMLNIVGCNVLCNVWQEEVIFMWLEKQW